jgi:hypothetical protein
MWLDDDSTIVVDMPDVLQMDPAGTTPKVKKQKRCLDPECPYCGAEPCGVCGPCRHPNQKSKCIRR